MPGVTPTSDVLDESALAAARPLATGLGRLGELGVWLSAATGSAPPLDLTRPVAIVAAGDHGVFTRHTPAQPESLSPAATRVQRILDPDSAVRRIASDHDVRLVVVDASVDADPDYVDDPHVTAHRLMRGCGAIDVEDAMTTEDAASALATGRAIVDNEVDAGADLLLLSAIPDCADIAAATVTVLLAGSDPVGVTPLTSALDDGDWMTRTAAIRDAAYRGRAAKADMIEFLARIAGPDLALLTGAVLQASLRRTPVVLCGDASAAAALVAQRMDFRARLRCQLAQASSPSTRAIAADRLDLDPIHTLDSGTDPLWGGLLTVPLLRAAIDGLQAAAAQK
jgi:nicotinate-nucleotide--dimethylbenzimidazole phosphoribosyltransferase